MTPSKSQAGVHGNRLVVCVLLTALAIGCGGSQDAEVSGHVTFDGEAIETGIVTFYPTAQGAASIGQIGDDGRYHLSTGLQKGLAPGDYLVTVEAWEWSDELQGEEIPGESLIPERYADRKQSDLQYTVSSGNNSIDIKLMP